MREYILGLSPINGGRCFAFHPNLGDLEWADGELYCGKNAVVCVKLTRDEISLILPTGYTAQLPNDRILVAGTHHLRWEMLTT